MKSVMLSTLFAAAVAFGLLTASPGEAQQTQQGVVNVQVGNIETGDILSENRVGIGVAANVAASVCGVAAQVGVIAEQVARTGSFRCENNQTNRFVQITR